MQRLRSAVAPLLVVEERGRLGRVPPQRLEQLADERERRERAAAAADEEFSAGFLNAARDVFIMMDKDDSGTLTKEEILHAVKNEDEVQKFLISCGNQNLSDLMVPSKLEKTLAELDTDKSGEVDLPEWCVSESQTLRGDGALG